jgi:hypothetical protein
MRWLVPLVLVVLSSAGLVTAQDPNVAPKWLKSERLGRLEVRWVDFGWTPEGFAAMESGGAHPAAGREWMLAMLRFEDPLRFEGRTIPVGPALLVLIPKRGEAPLAFDLREVDIREMLFEPNIIGTPPKKGERLGIRAANFEVVPETLERLDMKLTAAGRDTLLTIRYGNRKAEIKFLARE